MWLPKPWSELGVDPCLVGRVHLSRDTNRHAGAPGGIDGHLRALHPGKTSDEAGVIACGLRSALVIRRIESVMDDIDVRQRHLPSALVLGNGDVVCIMIESIKGRQLLVSRMVDGVDHRNVRNEARARQRHGRVRMNEIERTAFDHLLHCPRRMVHIGERLGWPLRCRIQKAQLGRS